MLLQTQSDQLDLKTLTFVQTNPAALDFFGIESVQAPKRANKSLR